MKLRKLFDWRILLIYSHRWLGIVLGLMFVIWCISGVILMYQAMPRLTAAERLFRMEPLNLETVTVTPGQAALAAGLDIGQSPSRLRVAMIEDRPVYRLNSSGRWSVVYADSGEPLDPLDAGQARQVLADFLETDPERIRYDAYLTQSDLFTLDTVFKQHLPLHRLALDDSAGTEYYVAERTGEPVLRTDHWSRFLGFTGYSLHRLQFMKEYSWWQSVFITGLWLCLIMSLTGVVLGIWRYSFSAREGRKALRSRSPYQGLMKWHHYAGLFIGVFMSTWALSGSMMGQAIPGISAPFYGGGRLTQSQQAVVTGGEINLEQLTVPALREAVATIASEFPPKEFEITRFDGELYITAYRAPDSMAEADTWVSTGISDFIAPAIDQERVMISAERPENGIFSSFERSLMVELAETTMQGVPILGMEWINEYDTYYYETVPTFNSAAQKAIRPLPALRVRYDDPENTVMYFAPANGQIAKYTDYDRFKRWGYFGLHALDLAALRDRRPLWDIVTAGLLIGCAILSITTLLPAYRRLRRHLLRVVKYFGRIRSTPRISPVQR